MSWFNRAAPAGKKKICILGLDGTPYTLLESLCNAGKMPNLKEISGQGTLAPMTTALPEISSVAWSSFMTGKNPGKHNIYGFSDLKPNSYDAYFPNYTNIKSKTMWDIVGGEGKRSVIINVPSTYPARELNGILISGFVALDLEKAVYPLSLAAKLKMADYRIDVNLEKAL